MRMCDSPLSCNFLGIVGCIDDMPKRMQNKIYKKMQELQGEASKQFDKWLNELDLESAMGIVVQKGRVK